MQNSLASSSGSGQADSQLFAILLLLARVQPIADSAGVSTILIEPFIALVLRCIGSSHHAIREAAARSLANLCSEDQPVHSSSFLLMEQCKRLLEESLAKSNWNSVDGALLAIDTLVKTSEASKKAFRDLNVESNLFNIVALDKATMLRPPCCLATSIEILATVSNENERDKMEKILFSACKQVVAYRDLDKDIGGAKLLGTASRYLCRSLQARLWRPENEEDLKMCLGDMGSLLTCSVIDVRLSAAKSFKKGIYSNIDQLLACNEPSGDRALNRSKILSSVAFLLLKSLQTEIERGKQQVEKAAVHIPTVRRISRCLLECFYGLLALEDGSATLFSDSLEATGGTSLWSTAVSMTNLESFLDDTPLESNGETFLSSNAAELMGITIAHRLTEGLSNNNTEFRDKLHVFLKVVNRLNHPKSSWRSRHSAVISLETSQILNTNLEVDNYCRGLQKNALFEVLGMLQDSDPDVRAVAVRAAGQFGNSEESSKNLFRSLLPELMLQNTFPKVYVVARSGDTVRHDEQAEIVDALLKSILSNCGNILETMQKIEEELLHTCETSAPASSLLNKTTTRKIFEEEDPNPSNERMLANQLATRSLLKMKDWPQGCLTLSNELFLVCSSCLEIVARNIRVGGIAHEITRFPTIFPGLHGIICGASVALHLGVEDVHGIKESARKIVEMGRSFDCSNLFHPDVLKALESLAKADTTTESEIAKDAFLLDNL